MNNQSYIELEKVKKKIEESLARYGEYSNELIELYEEAADIYCSLEEYELCKEYLLKVLNIKKHFYGDNNIALIKTYNQLTTVAETIEEIVFYLNEIIKIKTLIYGVSHLETANTYAELANAYAYVEENEKALYYYELALNIYITNEDNYLEIIGCYNEIASIKWMMDDTDKAIELEKKALEYSIKYLGENHMDTGNYYCSVGIMYDETDCYEEALIYLQKGLDILEKILEPTDENLIFVKEQVQKTKEKLK